MGVDACIYFRAVEGREPDVAHTFDVRRLDNDPEGATHTIDVPWRFWAPDYYRGPWPEIAAVLLELLACPDILDVWYDGDSGGSRFGGRFTLDDWTAFSRCYVDLSKSGRFRGWGTPP